MPFLRNIGVVTTFRCQIACPHCIIEAGPHRTEELQLDDAFDWTRQIAEYRDRYIKVLSLTGGEPFYDIDKLQKIASYGARCGLLVSVVTNAYWASTRTQAVEILSSLPAIKMMAISTDVYHQESIPFESVVNAIAAAQECNIPYHIAVCTENEDDEGYNQILRNLRKVTGSETIKTAITFPAGRALNQLGSSKYETTTTPPVSACSAGSSPIIFPDGRVIACIGPVIDLKTRHPLLLGNLRENSLETVLNEAESNPILHAIRIWGPKKLISIIEEAGLSQYLPNRYIHNSVCYACYSLMSNRKITNFLDDLANDEDFKRTVAYARAYYLKETKMAELHENS